MTQSMTLKEAAERALLVQNGCNLSGITHTFSRILTEVLWPEATNQGQGTEWVNRHPISILFVDKLADLCGANPNDSSVSNAYKEVKKLAGIE